LIVFDRVRNEDGASVFTLLEDKVMKVVVYQHRDQAIAENYGRLELVQAVTQL
jgi:hypothetical protein